MGRKKRASVNQRAIWVYLENPKIADEWKKAAKNADMSASNFVKNIVNNYLQKVETPVDYEQIQNRLNDAIEEVKQLRSDNAVLSDKLERMSNLLSNYEEQIREHNKDNQLNILNDVENIRDFGRRFIDLIKKNDYLNEDELLDKFNINPTDKTAIKTYREQIEILLDYGLIKRYKGGYLWQGRR
jgi:predicted nuclease with TOPRIM domain